MKYTYPTSGTCSRRIDLEVEDGIIKECTFTGGCHGNTQGLSAMVKGQNIDEVGRRLRGIKCGSKGTSCPDQLALAIEQIKNLSDKN